MSDLWEMERGDLIREVEELTARLAAQQPVIDAARAYEAASADDELASILFAAVRALRAAAPPEATPLDEADLLIETLDIQAIGVRFTHVPTGLTAESRSGKSQLRNKDIALRELTLKVRALDQGQT